MHLATRLIKNVILSILVLGEDNGIPRRVDNIELHTGMQPRGKMSRQFFLLATKNVIIIRKKCSC